MYQVYKYTSKYTITDKTKTKTKKPTINSSNTVNL